MEALGLLDMPPEIQLRITEFVETRQTLKALSVTSRSLRRIAQSMLFENLQIVLGIELRGSVDDLLANPRICASIRFLWLRGMGQSPGETPRSDEEQLSLIQKILPKMVGLRKVWISQVNLSKAFLDAFLGIAVNMPLQIALALNIYPHSAIPTPHTPLQMSHFAFILTVDHQPLEFYRPLFHASTTTLTWLGIWADGDGIMKLADINLPFLRALTLSIAKDNEVSRTSAAAFITAQRAIRKLILKGEARPLPPIPPNALPNLRELEASPEQVSQLVPGRPVGKIEVISSQHECDQDWFREEVGQSTARVRSLRVHTNTAMLGARMVTRMVTVLPFLKILWLPVFGDVSRSFRLITRTLAAHFLQECLNIVDVLTSLKYLKYLGFNLFRREVWVDLNINDIATKLRNANSSLTCLELRDSGGSGWKNAISVWNEVFGVFHQMESRSY